MEILTVEEKSIVAGILLDSRKYNELMDSPTHQNVWALDYVHDSRLRRDFESQLQPEEIAAMKHVSGKLQESGNANFCYL